LRGAVGFSLAIILSQKEEGEITKIFLTTTLFMVYFTVFVQGCTIKFLVEKLNIQKEGEKVKLISNYVHLKTIDLVMSGIGSIHGDISYSAILENLQEFDQKVIKTWLIRNHSNTIHPMTDQWNKITLQEHYARLYGPSILAHERKLHFVLDSHIPGNEKPSYSSPEIEITPPDMENIMMLRDKHENYFSGSETPKEGLFMLTNTEMDKSILQRAFVDSAYERNKRSEYTLNLGMSSSIRRNSIIFCQEDVLMERRQSTNAIWQTAFPQILEQRRQSNALMSIKHGAHDHILEEDDVHPTEELYGAHSDMDLIKNAYDHAKNEFKGSKPWNGSPFIVKQNRQAQVDPTLKNQEQHFEGIIHFDSEHDTCSSIDTIITKL
jgi:hypothetical protein